MFDCKIKTHKMLKKTKKKKKKNDTLTLIRQCKSCVQFRVTLFSSNGQTQIHYVLINDERNEVYSTLT